MNMTKKGRMSRVSRVFTLALLVGGTFSSCPAQSTPVDRRNGIFDFCFEDDASECKRINESEKKVKKPLDLDVVSYLTVG